jgi:hypothetical protein
VLGHGDPGEWDDGAVALPYVIVDVEDTLYKMWYGGTDGILFQTGYATSDLIVSVEEIADVVPTKFILHQNYPNPFNPSTKIIYSVPKISKVVIKIFDVLGNEIETLVNEDKPAGEYEIEFVGDGSTSGIYFYQIKAGEFIQTRKMILIK